MTDAIAVLDGVRKCGGDLVPVDGCLRYRGGRDGLTDELRAKIAEHRADLLLELAVEAAEADLAAGKTRLAPMNARLLELYEAGDQAAAAPLHAEVRDLVDSAWLPIVKRLGLALYRVGRLPARDLPLGPARGPGLAANVVGGAICAMMVSIAPAAAPRNAPMSRAVLPL